MIQLRVRGANLKEVHSKFLEQQIKRPKPQILFLFTDDRDSFGKLIVNFGFESLKVSRLQRCVSWF
jgi:hypothetical protein